MDTDLGNKGTDELPSLAPLTVDKHCKAGLITVGKPNILCHTTKLALLLFQEIK